MTPTAAPPRADAAIPEFRLYHYWRSSSSWRVRWALAYKGVAPAELVGVDLLGDEAESPAHRARNPLGYVPALEFLGPAPLRYLTESVAICLWLEQLRPEPALLPAEPWLRARTLALCEIINSGTQPLQNPNVAAAHSDDPAERERWNRRWIAQGLAAFAELAAETAGRFCVGDELSLADCFLAPQIYNARRFGVDLSTLPLLERLETAALATPSGRASHPDAYAPGPR